MALPHYTYLVLKMPGPRGIITVKGSFELSDLCDKEFHKMAQPFGMIAEYGQLNGKATRRRPRKTRSEETSSPSIGPKRSYNKGVRDSSNLNDSL
jgi:hypothetical protein